RLLAVHDAQSRTQAARAVAPLKAAQADVNAIPRGGSQAEVLTLDAQLITARTERDAAARNLDALRRLQRKGAASVGEVKEAEAKLQSAEADLQLLQQKQKERYSGPEIAKFAEQKSQ